MRASKRAVGYIRVSRYKSESQVSPESQRERLEAYCKSRGWPLVEVFTDLDVSGSHFDRPGWKALVRFLEPGMIIVCNEFTRLGRNLRQTLERIEELSERGVEIVSLEQELDTTTAAGRLQYQILLVIAEFERNRIRERMKQTQAELAREGRFHGGRLPFGYRYHDPGSGDYAIEPDPDEAQIVRYIYEMRAAGNSVKSIIRALNESGQRLNRTGRKISDSTTRHVLANRSYIGEREIDGKIYPLNIPELVDRELWNAAHAVRVKSAGRRSSPYLLTGVLRCGRCGSGMRHSSTFYDCSRRSHYQDCRGVSIRDFLAEPFVMERFFERVEKMRYREAVESRPAKKNPRPALESTRRKIAAAEGKQDRLLSLYLEGKVGPEVYERNNAELADQISELRSALARQEAAEALPPIWPGDIREDWKYLTLDERREVLSRFIEKITVEPGRAAPGKRLKIKWKE